MDYEINANPATCGENKAFHNLLPKNLLLPTVLKSVFNSLGTRNILKNSNKKSQTFKLKVSSSSHFSKNCEKVLAFCGKH